MKPHKYAELIHAYADGETIQTRVKGGAWQDFDHTIMVDWNFDGAEYQIKPKSKINENNMKQQKFFRGDAVRVADDLGASMSHFKSNCLAIVIGSYAELCDDDNNVDNFQLYILPKGGTSAWYKSNQLTLIGSNRYDLLPKNNRTRLNWEAQQMRGEK